MDNYYLSVKNSVDPAVWNDWVKQSINGTIFETTFWADRLVELLAYEPRYIALYRQADSKPLAIMLCFRTGQGCSRFTRGPLAGSIRTWLKRLVPVYLWHGSPVLLDSTTSEIVPELLSCLQMLAAEEGIVRIEPSPVFLSRSSMAFPNWEQKLWATYSINLQLSEDELWRNLKPSARKAIRRAERDGIVVRRLSQLDELKEYYEFAQRSARRIHKPMYGLADFTTMWKHFRSQAIFEVFVAQHTDKAVAGLGIWGFNGLISEWGAFQCQEAYEEKLYGQDLIKWEVIRWGHDQGLKLFDLSGVNPAPQAGSKDQGIRQFKEKWGGLYQEYWLVSKHLSSLQKQINKDGMRQLRQVKHG